MVKILNVIGLVLGLIGVIIIFIWGPPQPKLEEGIPIVCNSGTKINGITVSEHDKKVRVKKRCHLIMSRVGLGLVFVGFIFQLCSTLAD